MIHNDYPQSHPNLSFFGISWLNFSKPVEILALGLRTTIGKKAL